MDLLKQAKVNQSLLHSTVCDIIDFFQYLNKKLKGNYEIFNVDELVNEVFSIF